MVKEYKLKATRGSDGKYVIEFKDVYKKILKKSFENTYSSDFKLQSASLRLKLKSGWSKSSKDVKVGKSQEIIMEYLAVTVIERAFLRRRDAKLL